MVLIDLVSKGRLDECRDVIEVFYRHDHLSWFVPAAMIICIERGNIDWLRKLLACGAKAAIHDYHPKNKGDLTFADRHLTSPLVAIVTTPCEPDHASAKLRLEMLKLMLGPEDCLPDKLLDIIVMIETLSYDDIEKQPNGVLLEYLLERFPSVVTRKYPGGDPDFLLCAVKGMGLGTVERLVVAGAPVSEQVFEMLGQMVGDDEAREKIFGLIAEQEPALAMRHYLSCYASATRGM